MERGEGGTYVDEVLLVVVGVALGDRVGRRGDERVVVGDVGGKTTDSSRRGSVGVEASEELGSGRQVRGPAEPASVTSVEVHEDVGEVELLDGVGDAAIKLVSNTVRYENTDHCL